jgi:hypothetical protein
VTTATTIPVRLQLRQDTAANWTSVNPVLLAGELGRETDTGKIKIGNGSSTWTALAYQPFGGQITNADIASNAEIAVSKLADGTARQLLQTDAAGTGVEWTSNVDVPGTLDVTGASTFDGNVTIQGDLTVNGTETIINTQTLDVEDKNIVIGKVTTPSDTTADGGGITLKGTTDKLLRWLDATDSWTSSEHFDLASGKGYYINGVEVLSSTSLGTGVTGSSLTSVGTIGTGTWQGTTIGAGYGGTGIAGGYGNGELLIGKTDGSLAKTTLTAGTGITITNGDGSISIASSGGTVTSVTATSPLASTGGTTPDISIQDGTTTQKGAVQLEDSTSSTSTTTAATPAAVKSAYDLANTANTTANAALPAAGGTLTGDVTLANQADLRLGEATANGTNYVGFQAPAAVAADVLWTLPATDGSSGQVLSTNGTGTLSWATAATGDVTLTGTQTLTNKTLTDPAIIGTILEDVYTITDGAAFEVDPGNGSVQLITLGANRTPKATNFAAGESITLMVDDGSAYTLTWTDATWGTSGVEWVGGSPPDLATSGYTVIQFWKVASQVYGAYVGDVA